jgi:F-type H+-transporting ATPase subunit b
MEKLGIDPKILIAQIVNFGIVFFLLKKFLFKPLIKIIDDRNKKLNDAIDNSKKIEEKLLAVETESKLLLTKARDESKIEREELLKLARSEREKVIEEAKIKAEKEYDKGLARLRAEEEEVIRGVSDKFMTKVTEALYKKVMSESKKERFPLTKKILG